MPRGTCGIGVGCASQESITHPTPALEAFCPAQLESGHISSKPKKAHGAGAPLFTPSDFWSISHGFQSRCKPEHDCSGSESRKSIRAQDPAASSGPGAGMADAGSGHGSHGHKEPFMAVGLGLSRGVRCQPVRGRQHRRTAWLCLRFVPAAGSSLQMCCPLFSSARAERDLFRAQGQLPTSAQCSGHPMLVATAPTPITSVGGNCKAPRTGAPGGAWAGRRLKHPVGSQGRGRAALTLSAEEPGYAPTSCPQPPPHRRG